MVRISVSRLRLVWMSGCTSPLGVGRTVILLAVVIVILGMSLRSEVIVLFKLLRVRVRGRRCLLLARVGLQLYMFEV